MTGFFDKCSSPWIFVAIDRPETLLGLLLPAGFYAQFLGEELGYLLRAGIGVVGVIDTPTAAASAAVAGKVHGVVTDARP